MTGSRTSDDDLVRRVEAMLAIITAGDGGYADIRRVAVALGTSVRTLQRRLRSEGATFAAVVRRTRCAEAIALLHESGRVGDVARRLGYSDTAHFTRAFHRWTGLTPREFRRQR
jgi:AraC-like DNA-binding protein